MLKCTLCNLHHIFLSFLTNVILLISMIFFLLYTSFCQRHWLRNAHYQISPTSTHCITTNFKEVSIKFQFGFWLFLINSVMTLSDCLKSVGKKINFLLFIIVHIMASVSFLAFAIIKIFKEITLLASQRWVSLIIFFYISFFQLKF